MVPGLDLSSPPIPHPKAVQSTSLDNYVSKLPFIPVLIGNSRRWRTLPASTTVPAVTARSPSAVTVTGAISIAISRVRTWPVRTSLRAAGKRYQRTRRGRFKHAERQRRYRSRRKKVTHQGSPEPPTNDPLATRSEAPLLLAIIEDEGIRCHFCGRLCSDFFTAGVFAQNSTVLGL